MNTTPNTQPSDEVRQLIDYIVDRHVPMHKEDRRWLANHLCEQLTPYLTPRPPAPVSVSISKGETFSDSSQGNAMRKKFAESVDAEWANMRIKELELCLHGLLGLEGKDTSAPKLKCYFDSARQLLTNIK